MRNAASKTFATLTTSVLVTGATYLTAELSAVHGPEAYPWLKPGDQVRLEVDRLGVISSTIRPSAPVIPLRP